MNDMIQSCSINIFLADLLVIGHALYVAFVVLGFIITWVGYLFGWSFVHNFYFRIAHLIAIGIVVLQALVGTICPLTVWEDRLRLAGGEGARYEGSFIQHWLHKVLYYDISLEVFAVIYTAFFLLVIATFFIIKTHRPKRKQ